MPPTDDDKQLTNGDHNGNFATLDSGLYPDDDPRSHLTLIQGSHPTGKSSTTGRQEGGQRGAESSGRSGIRPPRSLLLAYSLTVIMGLAAGLTLLLIISNVGWP